MATVTSPCKTRKPARETHGVCRLSPACNLPLPQALDAGEAVLTLRPERGDSTSYQVQRLADPDGCTVGFRLMKLTWYIVDRKFYDIDVTGRDWLCDCPDAQFQNRECKHCHALRAALKAAGIEVVKPQRQHVAEPVELDDL